MGIVNQDNITDVVVASLGKHGAITARQREIMTSLIRHMHGFIKDVKLQHSEFLAACDYLARAGKLCNENRQEFIGVDLVRLALLLAFPGITLWLGGTMG